MNSIEMLSIQQVTDDRGIRYNVPGRIWEFLGNVADLHIVTVNPNAIRGNHLHHHAKEAVIVEADHIWEVAWQAEGQTEIETRTFESGVHLICIPAGVAHAFHNYGSSPIRLNCYMDRVLDMENLDQEWCKLL